MAYVKTQENAISIVKYRPATTVVTIDNDNGNYRSIRKNNPQEMNLVVCHTFFFSLIFTKES